MMNHGEGTKIVFRLFDGRRLRGEIVACLNTTAGPKYRVASGSLVVEICPDQVVSAQ